MKIFFAFILLFLCFSLDAQRDTLNHTVQSNILINDYQKILRNQFDFTISTTGFKPVSFLNFSYPNTCMSGLFCKMEHKIEKVSAIAPRFRLGSVRYADWMEGKGELYMRYWK